MKIDIPLTPSEEARLSAAARRAGMAPEEWIKRVTLENLSGSAAHPEEGMEILLRSWQEQDAVTLSEDVPVQELFRRWDEEDAQLSVEERQAEERLWGEIERKLHKEGRPLGLRPLDE